MPPLTARLWSAAATAAAPALRLMLHRRAARGKEIAARLPERRGIDPTPRPPGKLLWLHAASVGEAVSALPVVAALPGDIFTVLTTGTATSARLLETRLPLLGLDRRVIHRFVPLDVPAWADRFVTHWRPDAAAFLESELWPNLLAACRSHAVPVALLNARLSARSAAAWSRAPGFARHVLRCFAWIAAQSHADAERLRALGAQAVDVPGNLKYAAPPLPADPAELEKTLALAGGRPRWLAASTHPPDDAVIARVHQALLPRHPQLLTAIAPRHPERGAAVASAMGGAPRRALGQDFAPDHSVWVADTVGEMGLLYRLFPTVFMGKSFPPCGGGQNFLEPAQLGCAVATGPATENFAEARALAEAAGALTVVPDEPSLIAWLDARLRAPQTLPPFAPHNDLPAILARRLADLMVSRPPPAPARPPVHSVQPAFWRHDTASRLPALLAPLSPIVAAVTARRVRRPGWRAPVPVICCGNAVVGGSGKTTLAIDLARRLQGRGIEVHFLTRGYGGAGRSVLRVDAAIHLAADVGDEALLLAAVAPTWRAADRAAAARRAVEAGAQFLLMDDGLQNPGLQKSLSLLVIDGGYGFGNNRILPAGPLRESAAAAAARCGAAVLIGADDTGALAHLPACLPVLRASLCPGPEIESLAAKPVVAFAGIARPEKFFAMLRAAGIRLADQIAFPDHHPFTEAELASVVRRAAQLGAVAVTTPKDLVRIDFPVERSIEQVGVSLAWESEAAIDAVLEGLLPARTFA